MMTASSPNEWGCKATTGASASDSFWEVEWGSIPEGAYTPSWAQPKPAACQAVYCVPMTFMIAGAPSTQNAAVPCTMTQFSSGMTYAPSVKSMPEDAAAESPAKRTALKSAAPAFCPILSNSDDECATEAGEATLLEGELPSVGSAGHADGSCKRCAFFPKGRCQNGADCGHCHFPHMQRSRLRKRGAARSKTAEEASQAEAAMSVSDLMEVEAELEENVVEVEVAVETHEAEAATPAPIFPVDIVKALNDAVADLTSEHETTDPSVSARSDSEEGTSDSEAVSPTSSMETPTNKGLASSPVSWMAQQRARKASLLSAREELPAADIARMARSLLNKLTEERFESLVAKILALPFSTPEHLEAVVAEVFEKATTEDCFRSLYAELCTRLDTHLAEQTSAIGGKAFRKSLVNVCQATFERNLQPPPTFADLTADERLEEEIKLKICRLGNMRFIGELLARRLLAPKLMLPIVHELITGDSAAQEDLIALLTVVAPRFDQKTCIVTASLKDAFVTLRQKSNAKGCSSRLRCQISDLLDARARGWAPRAALVA